LEKHVTTLGCSLVV